jgi:ABC-type transport system involved in multi-copper enzyme maturation permease subunit
MNKMIIRELIRNFIRRNLKISLVVTAVMSLVVLLLVIIFPDMPEENALAVSDSWPVLMKNLFGDPVYSFSDIHGWMYLQIFHITWWLAFGVLGAILAVNIVAKEVEGNTVDILLSCPVTRAGLILCRFFSVILILTAISCFMFFICCGGVLLAGFPVRSGLIVKAVLSGLFLSMIFASLSLLVSLLVFQQTLSVFITLGIMGFFFMYDEVLAKLYPLMDRFSFLNPFHYYQPGNILIHETGSISHLLMMTLFVLILLLISVLVFNRKEITQ